MMKQHSFAFFKEAEGVTPKIQDFLRFLVSGWSDLTGQYQPARIGDIDQQQGYALESIDSTLSAFHSIA